MFLFRFYPIVMILQGFCLYHAYKNGTEQRWYFIIIFFPLIGCLIYLYSQVYSKQAVSNVSEGIKGMIIEDYQVDKLLKKAKYSDTIANRTSLADEYFTRNQYREAIALYESCLVGFNKKDFVTNSSLLKAHYHLEEFEEGKKYGEAIKDHVKFKNSNEKVVYAWCLHKVGESELAEKYFKEFLVQFAYYPHRLEYARFMVEMDQKEEAKSLLNELIEEIEHLDRSVQKLHKTEFKASKALLQELS